MKKIAFIGCSYTAYLQENVEKNSWTYQLYKKYPQHKYYNYALGGHGPDYFRWCILDAKNKGVDAIFLSTTHRGRAGYLIDSNITENKFEFIDHSVDENYILSKLHPTNYDWASASFEGRSLERVNNIKFLREYVNNVNISDILDSYNMEWYKTASKLYNFDKLWVLDFRRKPPHILQHHPENNVWDLLKKLVNLKDDSFLYQKGICLAENDDHWTLLGNTMVLDHYILNEDVKKYLESH